jgi:ABC-type nitrate/sulfonate/bicarbonate transport systems, periplasmic components
MGTLLNKFAAVASTVMVAAISFAAPNMAQAQDAPKGDGSTIRMMASPFGSQSFIPFTIKKFGLDQKYGFKLEAIPYSDVKAVNAAIQGGAAEIAVFDWNSVALMRNAGVDVIGVAPFLTYASSIVAPIDSRIKGITDLKGTKFGTFSRTSVDWIMMAAAAKRKYNMDLAASLELQEGAPPLLRGALEQGRLDATLMYSSIAPDMLATGKFKNVFTVRDMLGDLGLPLSPYLLIATTETYAKAHPANVKAFVAAYKEVVDLLKSNDEIWTEQGANMKLSPEALKFYRDEIRADIIQSFNEKTNDTLKETCNILLETAGPQALGMSKVPGVLITTEYQ